MILKEPNFKRRAQRIKLPVFVEIEGKTYETKDISVLGIGVLNFHKQIQPGEELDARLILPFKEASVVINVKLVCKRVSQGDVGFEFKDLSPQKRRAIRQYIEFALEGRLDEVETVMSTLNLPAIETPVMESLTLAEEERANLYRSFKRRMWFWIVLGGLVFVVFGAFVVYNTVFAFKTFGTVIGVEHNMISPVGGIVKGVYVKPGDYVLEGKVLFELSSEELLNRIERIRRQVEILQEALVLREAQNESELLKSLKKLYINRKKEYLNAAELYKKGIISIKDFKFVENMYMRTKLRFLEALSKTRPSLNKEDLSLKMKLEDLKFQEKVLEQRLESMRVKAPLSGWVKEVRFSEGARVNSGETVVVMEKAPFFVVARIPNRKLTMIAIQEPVKIFSPVTGKVYMGRIFSVGSSKDGLSLKYTTVKIKLPDDSDLPPGTRVSILFINNIYAKLKNAF